MTRITPFQHVCINNYHLNFAAYVPATIAFMLRAYQDKCDMFRAMLLTY